MLAALICTIASTTACAEELVVPIEKGAKGGLDIRAGIVERGQLLAVEQLGIGLKYGETGARVSVDEAGRLSVGGERSFKFDESTLTGKVQTGPTGPSIGLGLKIPFRLEAR